jgi:hypothetical protein
MGDTAIIFDRVFSMPNKNTFEMIPARDFIYGYLGRSNRTYDPFCGSSKIAVFRNDLALTGKDSTDWLMSLPCCCAELVLFDPPYSPRQLKECYSSIGASLHDTKSSVWKIWKSEIARITEPNGVVLSFGNNSMGIGKSNGFKMERIRLIPHGGNHYDTICTAERKIAGASHSRERA